MIIKSWVVNCVFFYFVVVSWSPSHLATKHFIPVVGAVSQLSLCKRKINIVSFHSSPDPPPHNPSANITACLAEHTATHTLTRSIQKWGFSEPLVSEVLLLYYLLGLVHWKAVDIQTPPLSTPPHQCHQHWTLGLQLGMFEQLQIFLTEEKKSITIRKCN